MLFLEYFPMIFCHKNYMYGEIKSGSTSLKIISFYALEILYYELL